MGGGVRAHAEDGGAWGQAWAAARGDGRRRRGRRVMRRRWAALRRALDGAGGRTQLGAVGRRQAVAEAARGHGLALSDGGVASRMGKTLRSKAAEVPLPRLFRFFISTP
uniref:Uncharacterized protein n=1 Tax=Oryza barthii TaxID=65489 RepID=A0A0D3FIX6_9ORYZ